MFKFVTNLKVLRLNQSWSLDLRSGCPLGGASNWLGVVRAEGRPAQLLSVANQPPPVVELVWPAHSFGRPVPVGRPSSRVPHPYSSCRFAAGRWLCRRGCSKWCRCDHVGGEQRVSRWPGGVKRLCLRLPAKIRPNTPEFWNVEMHLSTMTLRP